MLLHNACCIHRVWCVLYDQTVHYWIWGRQFNVDQSIRNTIPYGESWILLQYGWVEGRRETDLVPSGHVRLNDDESDQRL